MLPSFPCPPLRHRTGAAQYQVLQADRRAARPAPDPRRQVLGADHADTLVSVVNAGVLANALGHYEDAQALYKEALEGFVKKLGTEHPNTIVTSGNLGDSLRKSGKFKEAERLLTEAYESCVRLAGPDHQ